MAVGVWIYVSFGELWGLVLQLSDVDSNSSQCTQSNRGISTRLGVTYKKLQVIAYTLSVFSCTKIAPKDHDLLNRMTSN